MRLILTFTIILFTQLDSFATIRYVRAGGAGNKNGLNWANASGDLQLMINQSSSTAIDTIYVAQGKYTPNRPANALNTIDSTNRYNAFTFIKNVRVFGGFPSTGNPALTERNHRVYLTTLSGDIGIHGVNTDNAYHVLLTVGVSITTAFELNGFTLSDAVADIADDVTVNGYQVHSRAGAGWCNISASPRIQNITISNNMASNSGTAKGAGMYSRQGSPELLNAVIHNNNGSNSFGGAAHFDEGSAILTNVLIHGNIASEGGGIYNVRGQLTLNNVTCAGNSGGIGGAIRTFQGRMTFNNCIIAGNRGGMQNGIFTDLGIFKTILNYNYSLIQGVVASDNNNLDGSLDPELVSPVSANAAPTAAGDYSLKVGSPCINAGSNALVPAGITTDLAGRQRIIAGIVDMGAYEYDALLPVNIARFYANVSGCDAELTWKAEKEFSMSHYEIETTTDGQNFSSAGKVTSVNQPDRIYKFELQQPTGTKYYRLKAVEIDGEFDYSRIIPVTTQCGETLAIMLYPNPATDELNIEGGSEGQYVQIINNSGRLMLQQEIFGSETRVPVKDLPTGIYHAIIHAGSGDVVARSKFVLK